MKSKVVFSAFPALFVLLMLTGSQNASAADVRLNFGVGGGHHYYDHRYRTTDNAYDTWYSDSPSYSYYDSSPRTVYVDPYVYSTPSVGFSTFYGNGYNHNNNYYSDGHGYYGGHRGGYSGGYSGGHRR